MKMILHVFRKDVRHLYPEILVTATLIAAFGWSAPAQWIGTYDVLRNMLGHVLRFLLPIVWLVLISRLIHEESLAGDQQFWITRPYRWGELFASKSLFIFCFIVVPFALVRIYLLHHAGLDTQRFAAPLAISTGTILFAIILPIVAIATVTTSFAKDILFVLISIMYVVVLGMFYNWLTRSQMPVPYLPTCLMTLAGLVLVAVIVTQYAARQNRTSRFILIGLPVTALLVAIILPVRQLVQIAYPESTDGLEQRLVFDPNPQRQQLGSRTPNVYDGNVFVEVPLKSPLSLDAAPSRTQMNYSGDAVEIKSESGIHWRSTYQHFTGGGETIPFVPFNMPEKIFEQVRNLPAHLDAKFPVETYREVTGQPFLIGGNETFASPEGGSCSVSSDETMLTCLFALDSPDSYRIEIDDSDRPCILSSDRDTKGRVIGGQGMTWSTTRSPLLSLDFDPVVPVHIGHARFCPGRALKLTTSSPGNRETLHLAIDNIKLGDYVEGKRNSKAAKVY